VNSGADWYKMGGLIVPHNASFALAPDGAVADTLGSWRDGLEVGTEVDALKLDTD
jgi:hypothetical protein